MELKELVLTNRSYRRFHQEKTIDRALLLKLIDLARFTPSGRNVQPLKFKVVTDKEGCSKVFDHLAWAGYLENGAPAEGERPSAYIVICNDLGLSPESKWDQGIVSQTILLSAVENGLGGCIIASIRKKELASQLALPETIEPVMVLALGIPKEEVVLTDVKEDGDIRYYRDKNGVHYVPKRSLEEILIE